ncbi:hypothetical protein [Aquimarina addita]
MKKIIAILLLLTLNSCFLFEENGIQIKIKNHSSQEISNVKFTTTEKLEVIEINSIAPNETVTKFLSMKHNKFDGGYVLYVTRSNGKAEISECGYYTNGSSLNKWIDFTVENDTTIVKFDATQF